LHTSHAKVILGRTSVLEATSVLFSGFRSLLSCSDGRTRTGDLTIMSRSL
jgi:hypothetical protein